MVTRIEEGDGTKQASITGGFTSKLTPGAVNSCNSQKFVNGKAIYKMWKGTAFDDKFVLGLNEEKLNALKKFCSSIDVDIGVIMKAGKLPSKTKGRTKKNDVEPISNIDIYKLVKIGGD